MTARTGKSTVSAKRPSSAKPAAKTPSEAGGVRASRGAKPARAGAQRAPKVALSAAGARLRAELAAESDPYGVTVLITQAARVADRLEVLDRLLSGDGASWLGLDWSRVDEVSPKVVQVRVDVRVDNPVLEERQQTTVLRHLLAEIHRQRAGVPMGPDDDDDLDGI